MKPYVIKRKSQGYCCRMCDGPLSSWKKIGGKALRKSDRQIAKQEIKESQEV